MKSGLSENYSVLIFSPKKVEIDNGPFGLKFLCMSQTPFLVKLTNSYKKLFPVVKQFWPKKG